MADTVEKNLTDAAVAVAKSEAAALKSAEAAFASASEAVVAPLNAVAKTAAPKAAAPAKRAPAKRAVKAKGKPARKAAARKTLQGATWQRFTLAGPNIACIAGGIAAASRETTSMEVSWIGADGSIRLPAPA